MGRRSGLLLRFMINTMEPLAAVDVPAVASVRHTTYRVVSLALGPLLGQAYCVAALCSSGEEPASVPFWIKVEHVKVALVIGRLGHGGAERQLMRLAAGLAKRGHEVSVMAYDGPSPLDAELTSAGVHVETVEAVSRSAKVHNTRRWVRGFRPDIVHGFMKRASSVAVLACLGQRTRPRLLTSDMSTATYARHRPVLWGALLLYAFADGVVTQTEENRRSLELLAPWLRRRVAVVRNGVETSAFAGPIGRPRAGPFRFCVVGTVYSVKNPVRVVEAAASLRDRGAGGFHIDWYGRRGLMGDEAPSDDYRAAITRVEALGLEAHVTFHGQVTDVAKALREADALLHVSLQEGFPNAVVEGMASGLPIVVSRVSDLPLVVAEAENGTVVDQLSSASIAEGMARIMSTPETELAAMGRRSRDLAARWFGHDRFVSDFEALYARLVGEGGAGRREL